MRAFDASDPISGEILDTEHLEGLARDLARSHRVGKRGRTGREIMSRVRANGRALLASYRSTARTIAEQRSISPAAEWLVDNFHVVDEQLREIRDDLAPGFHRGLPKLASGPLQGYPRVLAIVWSYVEHTDSRFEPDSLRRFLLAYQDVEPLKIGELWAVPVWLRLLLVENLRRLTDHIVETRTARERANALADTVLGALPLTSRRSTENVALLRTGPLSPPFAVELLQRLRDQDPAVTPVLRALDERLARQGTSRDEIVAREHQRQASMHVAVRNVITSMRTISAEDWPTFFESISLVDEILGTRAEFSSSDFATRDRCRAAIEELARCSRRPEVEIAKIATALADRAAHEPAHVGPAPNDPATLGRLQDPAYYLISRGRGVIEQQIGYRAPLPQRLRRAYAAHATVAYLAAILVLAAAILALPLAASALAGASVSALLILGALGAIPASEVAIAIVNASVSDVVGARRLARLSLRRGIPNELRTLVAIPALLSDETEVRELIERLEVHYLGNNDGDIYFALVSDWVDAPAREMPTDEALWKLAIDGIAALNARYGETRFYLFHRRRAHNHTEEAFIGWERKRGKLHELNRLLRGAPDTSFITPNGELPKFPSGVQYVITLDADTQMPRGTAVQLVGTAAHPLNRPVFDERLGRVVDGYAILQPRVTPTLPSGQEGTLFQRVFSGPQGTDPYAFVVFDVYQDLFGEGIYTGKGIYEIDTFERALGERFPESAVLSHDLIEGIVARAGYVSDVELFESFPPHYEIAARRQHRWMRGDWQLLPWILGRPPGSVANPVVMSGIARWKLLDNLRRSLAAPAMLATLVTCWLLSGRTGHIWTTFILATLALPRGFSVLSGIIPVRPNIAKRTHVRALLSDIGTAAWQTVLDVTFLAHKAYLATDAVVRTLLRLLVTHRKLLEWTTAGQARRGVDLHLPRTYARMYPGVLVAIAAFTLLGASRPHDFLVWAPLAFIWGLSPAIARASSAPRCLVPRDVLSEEHLLFFNVVARKTWRFFETFVGAGNHELPPDNFQEDPQPVVAHRTSPTNIGMYVLSVSSAYDFGWVTPSDLVRRLKGTLGTLERVERFRGHLFNWYDTASLAPLEPKYISTVDSGNLAGHLITLAHACDEYVRTPFLGERVLTGFEVNLVLVRQAVETYLEGHVEGQSGQRPVEEGMTVLESFRVTTPRTVSSFRQWLVDLEGCSARFAHVLDALGDEDTHERREMRHWAHVMADWAAGHRQNVDRLFPWAALVTQAEGEARRILALLDEGPPTLADSSARYADSLRDLESSESTKLCRARDNIAASLHGAEKAAAELADELDNIAVRCQRLVGEMDFRFLYDPVKKLFSIGYRLTEGQLDSSYYDLLASEARLTSFVAIAKGDIPQEHWQKLGRSLTPARLGSALLSWSGSMFEYLMPELVMRDPEGSLLDQTAFLIVGRQMDYARARGVPWGISESAYNARDAALNYQYSSFGVSGLGLKRGLSQNLVIAPYASALAAMVSPAAASANLARLGRMGALGQYGFYDAIDFTPARLKGGQKHAIVQAYFAHHQGMTLVSLANVLHTGAQRSRFHADVNVRAAELLLHERTPRSVAVARPRADEVSSDLRTRDVATPALRTFQSPHNAGPRTHILSNGSYTVMVTAAGSGYSRAAGLAITRWREDPLGATFGSYVFLRDVESGRFWSAGYHPCLVEPESYGVSCSEDRVEIRRQDRSIATTMEVVVSPDDDAEVRQISLHNVGARDRVIEVTSYVELALAAQADDEAHPAFSSLFVVTEVVASADALVATRRKRQEGETSSFVAHIGAVQGEAVGPVEYETSRARFIGRGHTLRDPVALTSRQPLSGETGSVLSPILALRYRLRIAAGATARVSFTTLMSDSREKAQKAAQRYRVPTAFERTATLAWTHAQVRLRHHGLDAEEAHVFQRLASYLTYRSRSFVARMGDEPVRGNAALWSYGISGDLPIVVLRIDDEHDRDVVRQLLRAHEYWCGKALAIDVVILNERPPSYEQDLGRVIDALVRPLPGAAGVKNDKARGSVFVLRGDVMPAGDRRSLLAAARVILTAREASLADQVIRRMRAEPPARPPKQPRVAASPKLRLANVGGTQRPVLEHNNGLGGFANDGTEYVVFLGAGDTTPAPWINVIANERFGFQVSESGAGYTWSENSRENQLTAWSNDAIVDPSSEAIYVRDDESGEVWGPTASPIREESPYVARHGFGYSRFEHESHGIGLELVQLAAADDPVKLSRLIVRNRTGRRRTLSIVAHVEWVLGSSRAKSSPFVVTTLDETGALFAETWGSADFAGRTAFADLAGAQTSFTCDRQEFLGVHGNAACPPGLADGVTLKRAVGSGLDPCATLLTTVNLAPGAQAEIRFFLGQGADRASARALVRKYRLERFDRSWELVRERWQRVLGTVVVKTPDRELDLLVNGWLLYQTLSCRMWARSAFYQAGGAYGFRDQLQDSMALTVAAPHLARAQLVRAAERQFLQGDVQHWWHAPSGRGVRTRISDDRVWLAYAALHYIEVTGDSAVLSEEISFLEGPPLSPGQDDAYYAPAVSTERATLFEHCARALDGSLSVGAHGLPFMGAGDWNDGMNRVGRNGAGESVWLGWLLCATLRGFAAVADARGEKSRATRWQQARHALGAALEAVAWDGDWYLRAFFDDGTPLGSKANAECRIDSIAQSWSVLSREAPRERATRAMQSAKNELVKERDGLVLLLAPPFDGASQSPGYIGGYPPGIRENGGQYTHAAAWTIMAFAALGDGDEATRILRSVNPILHASDAEGVARYRVEPYVVAADVYSEASHVGRGGWTWYTGSAGWLYRASVESILGLRVRGDRLLINPCISSGWGHFEMAYTFRSTRYEITVENPGAVPSGVARTELDGVAVHDARGVPLVDDKRTHRIRVTMRSK